MAVRRSLFPVPCSLFAVRRSLLVAALASMLLSRASAEPMPRFFFAGGGRLVMRHAHFGTTIDVHYRRADGAYDAEALARIAHFFRSREDGLQTPIPLRLIELLAYVQDRYRPREFTLYSGYRSPAFNESLRAAGALAARASLHTQALAADVGLAGTDTRRVWRELRELQLGGVGYYAGGNYLHLDAGQPRFWEETTTRVGEDLSAGNARLFARTDFDRYHHSLAGAVVSLHGVTALPLLIDRRARLVPDRGGPHGIDVVVAPHGAALDRVADCYVIDTIADAYRFVVEDRPRPAGSAIADPTPSRHGGAPHRRGWLALSTCEPRVEKTGAEIETNLVEVGR